MQYRRWIRAAGGAAVVAALSLSATLARAQNAAGAREFTPILLCESVSALDLFAQPLDAGLRRALSMLPARLAELPDEIPDYDGPDGPTLALIVRTLLTSAPRVAVVDYGPDPQTGAPGIAALIDLRMEREADARALHAAVAAALEQAPDAPPTRAAEDGSGALEMDLPFGLLRFGPVRGDDGVWRFRATLGAVGNEAALFAALPQAPAPGRIDLRCRLNLKPLVAPLMGLAQMRGGEEAAPMLAPLTKLLATEFTLVSVQRDDAMQSDFRVVGARPNLTAMGVGEAPLAAADFQILPADSTVASIKRVDMRQWWAFVRGLLQFAPGFENALAQFREQTGVDPDADLFGALGDAGAFYLSDSTGGGGLLSTVVAVRLRDAAAFGGALDKLVEWANQHLAMLPPGDGERSYYRIQQSEAGGVKYFGVRFAGLPVPLEPTAAITGDWLVIAASPQAAAVAVAQAGGKMRGDLASRLRLLDGPNAKPLIGFKFIDSARGVRDGYALTTLLGSMLANGVRSASDPQREPGLVVPPFQALLGASSRDIMQRTWWEGDDLVVRGETPPSMLASGAAVIGAARNSLGIVGGSAFIGALVGQALPAFERARERAGLLRDAAQLKQLHLGMTIFANGHDGAYPTDVQTMIDDGLVAAELLKSPIEWAGDGEGDYFLRLGGKWTFEGDRLMGYSRAAYAARNEVNALFDDNHVETMPISRFQELLRLPENQGVDWRLPRRARQFEPDFIRVAPTPMKQAG